MDQRTLQDNLYKSGWTLTRSGNHRIWTCSDGTHTLTTSATPGDRRATLNQWKQALRLCPATADNINRLPSAERRELSRQITQQHQEKVEAMTQQVNVVPPNKYPMETLRLYFPDFKFGPPPKYLVTAHNAALLTRLLEERLEEWALVATLKDEEEAQQLSEELTALTPGHVGIYVIPESGGVWQVYASASELNQELFDSLEAKAVATITQTEKPELTKTGRKKPEFRAEWGGGPCPDCDYQIETQWNGAPRQRCYACQIERYHAKNQLTQADKLTLKWDEFERAHPGYNHRRPFSPARVAAVPHVPESEESAWVPGPVSLPPSPLADGGVEIRYRKADTPATDVAGPAESVSGS